MPHAVRQLVDRAFQREGADRFAGARMKVLASMSMSATFCSSLKALGGIEMPGREGELLGQLLCAVMATTPVWISASSLPSRAGAQRHALLRRRAAADQAIDALAAEHQPHRAAGELRRRGGQDLVAPQALAAEAAADERRQHADLVGLEAEHLGERARGAA